MCLAILTPIIRKLFRPCPQRPVNLFPKRRVMPPFPNTIEHLFELAPAARSPACLLPAPLGWINFVATPAINASIPDHGCLRLRQDSGPWTQAPAVVSVRKSWGADGLLLGSSGKKTRSGNVEKNSKSQAKIRQRLNGNNRYSCPTASPSPSRHFFFSFPTTARTTTTDHITKLYTLLPFCYRRRL